MSETSPSPSTASSLKGGKSSNRVRRRTIWAAVVTAVVAASVAGGYQVLRKSNDKAQALATAKVARGPMLVSITAGGELKAEEQETIINPVRWTIVIKELAPEGSIVKKGQLIIRMECKELDDAVLDQGLIVRSAQDDVLAATNKLLVTQKTMEARLEKGRQALQDALDDDEKYEDGEWPQERDEAEEKIMIATGKLDLAQDKLDSMRRINEDPALQEPYSKAEIKGEELNVEQLKLELSRAKTDRRLLHDYTRKRQRRDKKTAVTVSQLELETVELEKETQLRLAESAKASAEDRLNKQEKKLTEFQEDAEKLTVIAKKTGLVIYETRRRHWERPVTVAIDEEVRPHQQLMIIPNMETLRVETHIYEADEERVKTGQPALIRLPAKAGKVFSGKVGKKAAVPDSQNPWLSPGVKQYPVSIEFAGNIDGGNLKPGMNAEAEIIVAELQDVLTVPIAAVFAEGETTYCFRTDGEGNHQQVKVKLGQSSETRAQILSGLSEGDTVLLSPPPGIQIGKKLTPRKEREKPEAAPDQEATPQAERPERPAPTTRPSGEAGPTTRPSGEAGAAGRSGRTGSGGRTEPAERRR